MAGEFGVRILSRDFTVLPWTDRLRFSPARYSANARGGPEAATIEVSAEPAVIPVLLDLLRCPITIYSPDGAAVWWGYVSAVDFNGPGVKVSASLENMVNRVAVAYVNNDSCFGTPIRETTAWAENEVSIDEFGYREALLELDDATPERAEATRDQKLDEYEQPISAFEFGETGQPGRGTITAQGWYETLGWRYYATLTSGRAETSIQMRNIVDAVGQFLTGVKIQDRSLVVTDEYRDGDNTGLVELIRLMDTGVLDGRRYVCSVDEGRVLVINEEPSRDDESLMIWVNEEGRPQSRQTDRELPIGFVPAGRWVDTRASIMLTTALRFVAKPAPVFIERAEYTVKSRTFRITPRGMSEPGDLPGLFAEG